MKLNYLFRIPCMLAVTTTTTTALQANLNGSYSVHVPAQIRCLLFARRSLILAAVLYTEYNITNSNGDRAHRHHTFINPSE